MEQRLSRVVQFSPEVLLQSRLPLSALLNYTPAGQFAGIWQDLTPLQAVSTKLDVAVEQIRKAARGRGRKNEARWLAVHLCRDVGGYALWEIATYFGMRHVSGINLCVRKLRKTIKASAEDHVA